MVNKTTKELIQKLRQITGAGVLDCKNALDKSLGNIDIAIQILREKGITQVLKRQYYEAKNGLITAYVHTGNKIGVLIELNCETDFVARTDEFKNLAKEICLQIAAANPLWISREDVPADVIASEKALYKKQACSEGKPEKVIENIVEGRLEKFYSQVCLFEQPYIRDLQGKQKVKDVINEVSAKVGEKIIVRRFTRYCLGEEIQKSG